MGKNTKPRIKTTTIVICYELIKLLFNNNNNILFLNVQTKKNSITTEKINFQIYLTLKHAMTHKIPCF